MLDLCIFLLWLQIYKKKTAAICADACIPSQFFDHANLPFSNTSSSTLKVNNNCHQQRQLGSNYVTAILMLKHPKHPKQQSNPEPTNAV